MVAAAEGVVEEAEDEVVAASAAEVLDRAEVFLAERGHPWGALHHLAGPRVVDLRRRARDLRFPRRGQVIPIDPHFQMLEPGRDRILETVIYARAHDLPFNPALDQVLAQEIEGLQTFQVPVSVLDKELARGQASRIDLARDKELEIVRESLNSPLGSQGDCQDLAPDCLIREHVFKIAWAIRRTRLKIADPT